MTVTVSKPYRKPPKSIPPYPFYYVGVISDFTPAAIQATFVDQMTSNVSGDILRLTAGVGEFQYFLNPSYNGDVTFFDLQGGAAGGWDGGMWDNDDTPDEATGPRELTLNYGSGDEIWHLYRTDFSAVGAKRWRLTYSRNQFE